METCRQIWKYIETYANIKKHLRINGNIVKTWKPIEQYSTICKCIRKYRKV